MITDNPPTEANMLGIVGWVNKEGTYIRLGDDTLTILKKLNHFFNTRFEENSVIADCVKEWTRLINERERSTAGTH